MWAEQITQELREALTKLLPLNAQEINFIEKIRNEGKIEAELITNNTELFDKIKSHPAILLIAQQNSKNNIIYT